MVVDREKLKAMALARITKDMAAPQPLTQPREPEPLPPPLPLRATPHGRTRKPVGGPRRIPGQPAPEGMQEYLLSQRAMVRVNGNTYRISRPRDWNPDSPISFVSVRGAAMCWDYIGLIRPPGPFMWGRKSLISASDMRVILFDEFYATIRDPSSPRNDDLKIERL